MRPKNEFIKIIRIPAKNRNHLSMRRSINAIQLVFRDLYHTVDSQPPGTAVMAAKQKLSEAYEAVEFLIRETYAPLEAGETILEMAQKLS